jgi:hygromycin-B 7''-O-kinase
MRVTPTLPADPDVASFDDLHDEPERWQPVLADIVAAQAGADASAPIEARTDGTVLVARVGSTQVIKLYPPFLRDHFAFERAMLDLLAGRLSLPTPRLLASGDHAGWPWLLMTQLSGAPLTDVWPTLDEPARLAALRLIGRVMAQVHAQPVNSLVALAPAWPDFLARQRAGCQHRQQRNGLPAHLLAQLDAFIAGEVPAGPDVPLTGEYTPMNLLHDATGLSAMFDFGDGLVGPRAYDWLGPMCFLAAGHASRLDALFDGYGQPFDRHAREPLLRLLLLHRYSCLPAQIASPGWQDAPDFATLAERIWP